MTLPADSYFETEAGRRIHLVPGYRAAFPHFYWGQPEIVKEQQEPQQTYPLFLNHVYKYCIGIDLVQSIGLPGTWDKALDIGAMDGTLSRLFAGEGRVCRADALDLYDFTGKLTDETYSDHVRRLQEMSAGAPGSEAACQQILQSTPLFHEMSYVPRADSPLWGLRSAKPARINRFFCENAESFQPETRYDLVTAFLTMVVMDVDVVMRTVNSALEDGGIFIMLEPYWWYPYLFFGVAGEFPYAFQRLEGADMERYIEAHHLDDKSFLTERLGIFTHRHTVNDYIMAADRHDLSLLSVQRFIQTKSQGPFRAKFSPQYMNTFDDARLSDVVADIQTFRPDVQMLDLMTSFVALVFTKKTRVGARLSGLLTAT